MLPLDYLQTHAASIVGVLTDIDDTLTTRGQLSVAALQAMQRLRDAGLKVVPVTGSPASLALHAARLWPVDAAIGESGAVYYSVDRQRRLRTQFWDAAPERAALIAEREQMAAAILQAVPQAALASDQCFRLCDLAIDYCEDIARLSNAQIAQIKALLSANGYQVRQSSIHLNAWKGSYDKLPMAKRCLRELWSIDLELPSEKARWVYVGDAPNDEAMFEFFPHSVGVANVREHLAANGGSLRHAPTYLTPSAYGAGFAEVADLLCQGR